MDERISTEKIQALGPDEQRSMLLYLTGYLDGSPEFQDGLTRAYNAQMRIRARMAAL